ncbi:pyridoxamine 5'-phosphate oxidase family protein [Sporomusa sp.]|uniref:pyridoxamine 5'-phosphate oxidase family protein n=1 Tax=Sporomusa sp. TaxID=2078658 RepID=UPI002B8425A0|nr:pyridoxamine 5'-phosphate oxidase family protein [Sporomusa sp.]HWR07472.1 pyridoxamine 5'-phosphate oxidase family protein [Sporomusa sp.]HWR42071.1 pyridoxamine 5'-phosphate oxidase family protein [Sporomusa sp.]
MRLTKQELDSERIRKILETTFYGVLSTVSEDGMPYGVPLNHVLENNKLYFHCAVNSRGTAEARVYFENIGFTIEKTQLKIARAGGN